MKLELTEKDVFLLKLAISVLIVFMMIRFLIMPQIERIQEGQIQKEELLLTKEEMEEAIESIPSLKQTIKTRLGELSEVSENYYDAMENRQVDEVLTGLAVEMGLFPISLSINKAEPGIPAPYLYSFVPDPARPASESYVLTARGNMVLRGTESNVFRFMDAVEKNYPAVQVRSVAINEQEYMDGDWNVITESEVRFTLAVYMCDRSVVSGTEFKMEVE